MLWCGGVAEEGGASRESISHRERERERERERFFLGIWISGKRMQRGGRNLFGWELRSLSLSTTHHSSQKKPTLMREWENRDREREKSRDGRELNLLGKLKNRVAEKWVWFVCFVLKGRV